jgi:hypothetical protein
VADPLAVTGDGGDSPAWSRKRGRYEAPELVRGTSAVAYVELHCHSNFSFLDGASHPEELVEEAYRLRLSGLAMTDHDGLYGVVRFAFGAAPRVQAAIGTCLGRSVPWVAMCGSHGWPVVITACSWRRIAAAITVCAWVAVSLLVSRLVRCW